MPSRTHPLCENYKIFGSADIDKIAEMPHKNLQPELHECVAKHMIHGPSAGLNPSSVCMQDGKCSKEFPKDFVQPSKESALGYPLYYFSILSQMHTWPHMTTNSNKPIGFDCSFKQELSQNQKPNI